MSVAVSRAERSVWRNVMYVWLMNILQKTFWQLKGISYAKVLEVIVICKILVPKNAIGLYGPVIFYIIVLFVWDTVVMVYSHSI